MTDVRVDLTGFRAYIAEVRKAVPQGYEKALSNSGVGPGTQAYALTCYLNDVQATVCAANMVQKFKVIISDTSNL